MPVNRWFTRCTTCLAVSAIETPPEMEFGYLRARCGICNGQLENMGRVERDRLIHEHLTVPCDDRCTYARGNCCNCKCAGENHGTKRVVRVVTDAGPVPTITPSAGREQARINADEYQRHVAALRAGLDRLLDRRSAGEFLPRADFDRLRTMQATMRKVHAARDHRARMRALTAIVGHIPPASPVSEVAEAVTTAIQTAPPLAHVPFSLAAPISSRTGRQERLF